MLIVFDAERPSDSPFIERVWRCHSERAGTFLSVASTHWEMVVTRLAGKILMTVRGPETKATEVHCPADGEWTAIRFKAGTFMRQYPVPTLLDGRDVTLPQAGQRSFWLDGDAWDYPDFDNAETFVRRLANAGLIVRDTAVEAALHGDAQALSQRTVQRHFLSATGMTYSALRQIQRARYATQLLRHGVSITEAANEASYFDQAHLTRSLKRMIGLTPARIMRNERQLSFLYNTMPLP